MNIYSTSGELSFTDKQVQVSKPTGLKRPGMFSSCDEQRQVSQSPEPGNYFTISFANEEDHYSPPSSFRPVMKNISCK